VQVEVAQRPPLAVARAALKNSRAKADVPWTVSASRASPEHSMYLTNAWQALLIRRVVVSER
jgi:hypothetical protein